MKRIVNILLAVIFMAAVIGFAGCGKGYSVYGRVADELDQGIANVTITFSGGYSGTTTTDADGNWSKDGLKGTVLITPSRVGWTFTPSNKQVTKAATGVDFVATLFETPELTDDRFNEIIYQVDHITQLFNDMPSDLAVDQALIELSEDEQIYACGTLDSGTEVWWTTLEGIGCESGPIPEGIDASGTADSLKSKTLEDSDKAGVEKALSLASSGTYIGNDDVISFSPFHRTWPEIDQVPIIAGMLEEAGFNVTTPLYDDDCTVEMFRDLGGYGIINISTHGGSSQISHPDWINQDQTPQVRFMTGEVVSSESKANHKEDLEVGRLIIRGVKDDPNQYFSIMPQFIKDYWSPMPETLVFLEICHGADSSTMWDQMEQKGAEVCFAYYGLCYVSDAKDDAINIFTYLLSGDDCGTAFEKTLSENDFRMLGSGDVKIPFGPPTLVNIEISPTSFCVEEGHTVELTATGYDQYGDPIAFSEMPVWSVTGGIGITITPYQLPITTLANTIIGSGTVVASCGEVSGGAEVDIIPRTSDLVNIAASSNGGIATAGSTGTYFETMYPYYANDGDLNSGWCNNWNMPDWCQIEFDDLYWIEEVRCVARYHTQEFMVELSNDGIEWNNVGSHITPDRVISGQDEGIDDYWIEIPGQWARYIRVTVIDTDAPGSHIFQAIIDEIEAYANYSF